MERVARILDTIVEHCGRITAWASLAIVLVMAYNVFLRYAFSTGSVAMQELEWHLMAPIAILSMAYAIRHDGHVRVDVIYKDRKSVVSGKSVSVRVYLGGRRI